MGVPTTMDEPISIPRKFPGGSQKKPTQGKPQLSVKATKRGGSRGVKRRRAKFKNELKFSILGSNSAGLKAKTESLVQNIKVFNNPSCITLQETKMRHCGTLKLSGYQVFEKVRSGLGGGLFTAIDQNLNPVLIGAINEESEILVVQCQVGENKVRIINGYGPQEDDPTAARLTFWQSMEQEVVAAKNENCMVLIQMDANAKVGKCVLRDDPNDLSNNGQLLLDLIDRENLVLVNSSSLCSGAITRHRVTQENIEQSILDYIVVCEKLSQFLEMMIIP